MQALVVYESLFGNTAAIGESVARSLRIHGFDTRLAAVSNVAPAETEGVDLLVIGGPTHVHGMSSATSRRTAADDPKNDYDAPTVSPGLRNWVTELPDPQGRLAAVFDTRIDRSVVLTGSAARGLGRRLEARGFRLVTAPQSFFVSTDNRLLEGQIEHAATWAATVAAVTREAIPGGLAATR